MRAVALIIWFTTARRRALPCAAARLLVPVISAQARAATAGSATARSAMT
jgi:hypothetical protein